MSKLAIVTGGIRGIGAAICRELAKKNFTVVATYNRSDGVADKFKEATGIEVFKWDVANYEECSLGVKSVQEKMGKSVAVLINNAGITRDGMLHKSDPESWGEVINVNLTSCYNMCRCVIGSMRENNFGRIINISSINGLKGQVGQVNYAASKAGILGFTKALALESAIKNITVNAIAPGYINTDMVSKLDSKVLDAIKQNIPAQRLGSPDEVAKIASFLASDNASFITGETISVNGGQYMQ